MTAAAVLPRIADASLPADWRGEVEPRLDEGERPVASVELDLDDPSLPMSTLIYRIVRKEEINKPTVGIVHIRMSAIKATLMTI